MGDYNTSCDPIAPPSCPFNLDTTCVFYHMWGQSTSKLTTLGLQNGTPLEVILETIDLFLSANITYNYGSYSLSYLAGKYGAITDNKKFAESVDLELSYLYTKGISDYNTLQASVNAMQVYINDIKAPNLTDPCSIGFTATDTMKVSMQKVVNYVCTALCATPADVVPEDIVVHTTKTISATQGGTYGNIMDLYVRRSNKAGNLVTLEEDGVWAGFTQTSQLQTLAYVGSTGALSISQGNTVTIPPQKFQTLVFTCATGILTLSDGGGTWDLNCLKQPPFTESPFKANSPNNTMIFAAGAPNGHTLSGDVKIAATGAIKSDVSGLGLWAPVHTYDNGIAGPATGTSGVAGLGAPILRNTLLNGPYDVAINVNNLVIGNNYADYYGISDPAYNSADMYILSTRTHNAYPPSNLATLLNYNIDNTTSMISGAVAGSASFGTRYSISTNLTLTNSNNMSSLSAHLLIKNISAGNLTFNNSSAGSPRAMTAFAVFTNVESGYSGNVGAVNSVAAIYIHGLYAIPGSTNLTHIDDYYSLIINPSNENSVAFPGTMRTWGIVQQGTNDKNVFRGTTQFYNTVINAAGTTEFTSDIRVKDNVFTINPGNFNALGKLNCIRIVGYNLKVPGADPKKRLGVIGQELENIFPEAIGKHDLFGFDDFRTVNESQLLYMALEAIKELKDELDFVKSRL